MAGAVRGLASFIFACSLTSCGESPEVDPPLAMAAPRTDLASDRATTGELAPPASLDGRCDAPLPIYANGARQSEACESELDARGLTALDLSSDFAPPVFAEAPELGELGEQPYRAVYLALADERFSELPREVDPERYLELFGIFPTFRVLAARLAERERHACHDAVDDAALESMSGSLRSWTTPIEEQRERLRWLRLAERTLAREQARHGVTSLEALAEAAPRSTTLRRYQRDAARVAQIRAVQAHLRCDGLLTREEDGVFDARTARALADYQRRHVVVAAGALDAATRARMLTDSRELDFLAVLRTLRERVVAASGVVEDGSASGAWGTVLGRLLDPEEMRTIVGREPLANGAPDLVSPATEAAARALGWTSPEAFLARVGEAPPRVAVTLPARPAYHSAHMELRAEIDRGDVWYTYPYTSDGRHRAMPVERRPVLTLYARDGEREIALVRWPTTIGGWKPERTPDGRVGLRYKESPAGARLWRDVIAAPAWLPPESTPADELVRRVPGRGYVANTDLFGPGYRSAYGLAMVMMHRPIRNREGEPVLMDEGVRAHGSVSYASILRGTSHGCHRLYNHLAVRLGGFLIGHREHLRRGSIAVRYQRDVAVDGSVVSFRVRSRGVQYELTPPVPVEVLEGRVRGGVREAPRGFRPLRGVLLQAAQGAASADEGM